MNNIKILIVEDQKLMRIGIESLFNDYKEMEIIGQAVNGKEAIVMIKQHPRDYLDYKEKFPDVILLAGLYIPFNDSQSPKA